MDKYIYYDIDDRNALNDINVLFPGWEGPQERVCVLSPHDDDALIGAGYAISAASDSGAEVSVFIFCRGNAGYSDVSQKETIERIRRAETENAYGLLGIKKENIVRFNYPDFSVSQSAGWMLNNGAEGSFRHVVEEFRKKKITRVLSPNRHREHIDHTAVGEIGAYYSPQAGDPILVDWGEPHAVKSVAEYSVWADLSPDDALANGRDPSLRANRIISAATDVEEKIRGCIREYKSQASIIEGLVNSRNGRATPDGRFIEVYLSFDPRPVIDYGPYIKFIQDRGAPPHAPQGASAP